MAKKDIDTFLGAALTLSKSLISKFIGIIAKDHNPGGKSYVEGILSGGLP